MKEPFSIQRPWGSFRQFTQNEQATVKLLFITPEQELSLQTHKKRKEFWHVLQGNPELVIGEEVIQTKPGDEFTVAIGKKHRVRTPHTEEEAVLLEIAYGEFDENDIVRYDDKYGRA